MRHALCWDIFCRVIDHYGDAGVCWRLARQLAQEQPVSVRLWLDDLATLNALCPDIIPALPVQQACGVEVRSWAAVLSAAERPPDIVIEAFGCGLPEAHLTAMLAREPSSLWITLEYLSAEAWVAQHHGLPSPHPRLPIERYFYFPGFTRETGGILREHDVSVRRSAFGIDARAEFWRSCGFEPPQSDALTVSLFSYAGAPVASLLACWEHGAELVVAAAAPGHAANCARDYLGVTDRACGVSKRRGNLEVRVLPFVPQTRYDELLWSCDVNFVRGEDSFVRAQWAERPFVWHVYPQEGGAHRLKLDAFFDLYAAGLEPAVAASLRSLWQAWNLMSVTPVDICQAWRTVREGGRVLAAHGTAWARRVAEAGDLAGKLVQFGHERVKSPV